MHQIDVQRLRSRTDLTKHLACAHIARLDLAVSRRELAKSDQQAGEMFELASGHARVHEARHPRQLSEVGRSTARSRPYSTALTADCRAGDDRSAALPCRCRPSRRALLRALRRQVDFLLRQRKGRRARLIAAAKEERRPAVARRAEYWARNRR